MSIDIILQLYSETIQALALYEYWLYQPRIIVSNSTTLNEGINNHAK
jgi:hypothetical protein